MRGDAMKNPSENSTFETHDLCLAGTLRAVGFPLSKIETVCGRGVFIFKETPELAAVRTDFINGSLRVEPRAFLETTRTLKSAVIATSRGGGL